jgi:thiol-disulfide isomerase/thioredoxin
MKSFSPLLVFLFIICISCRTTRPAVKMHEGSEQYSTAETGLANGETNFSDHSTWLLGYFDVERLKKEPYSSWYIKGYDEYTPNADVMASLGKLSKDDLMIEIVMGTWCPDSRREVPRFMRILDTWQFPADNVVFIGVDDTKQSPVGGFDTLNIEWVPTFIFLKNKVEAGRIIENPETSLEQDMLNILTRNEK